MELAKGFEVIQRSGISESDLEDFDPRRDNLLFEVEVILKYSM